MKAMRTGFACLPQVREGVPGGLRLSYATLGAFTKYPKESLPHKPTPHIADKKYGFFQAEAGFFTGLPANSGCLPRGGDNRQAYGRHPLAFLVEAADDICYTIIDFEDGINLGLIPEDFALEYLIKLVKERIHTKKYHEMPVRADRLGYLRALAINTLINDAAETFLQHESEILSGNFETSLMEKSTYKAQIEDIIRISSEKIYRSQEVLEKEIAGYKVIADLLEVYAGALVREQEGRPGNYDRLLIDTLPRQFRAVEGSLYTILLNASCFVASLSDRAAVNMHNKITGKSL